MKVSVKYFGMVSEAVERAEEIIDLQSEDTEDLQQYFEARYPSLGKMNYKIAVNQKFVNKVDANLNNVEIALLPPFAGG